MIIAISMVKNEADIITYTMSHLFANGIDEIIIADNNSTDGTGDLIRGMANQLNLNVTVIPEPMTAYYQSKVMTNLYRMAIDRGADWVIPFDADELVVARFSTISDALRSFDKTSAIEVKLYDHRPTSADTSNDLADKNPFRRWKFRDRNPQRLGKVIIPNLGPSVVIWQGNHGISVEDRVQQAIKTDLIEIRHFKFYSGFRRGAESAIGRLRGYEETDFPEYIGAHWRTYGRIAREHGVEVLEKKLEKDFFVRFDDKKEINLNTGQPADMVYDPAPWAG